VTFQFRAAEPADRPALFRLFENAFGAPADPRIWEWKYDRNPNPAPSAVALLDGEVVGFYGGWGTRYRGREGNRPGVAAVDVMTEPAVKTLGLHGLFAGLGEAFCGLCREAGIPFYFGFPNERHRLAGERILGYVSVEPAAEWTRPVGLPGLLGRIRRRLRSARAGASFSAAHDPLAEELNARPGWRTDRSRAVLNWRFSPHADASYRVVELLDPRGASSACAALRVVEDRALLVELQVRDEESGALADLLDAAEEALAGTAARRLVLRAPAWSRLTRRAVEEFGFAPAPSDCHFEVRPLDPSFDAVSEARAFDYRFLDHEIF
jgi:hypothetical protein